MFIDETEITVSSGRGGDGLVSFRREKFVPRGGPDGGDGGNGGDIVLRSSVHLNTLAGLQHRRHYRGGNGQPGGANNRTGRNGESLLIEVPVGTLVRDRERGHVLRDLSKPGVEFVVVSGGRGGKGNKHFAHSTNQTPRRSTQGQPGQVRELRLELRLVADVGLVGLPNAGKSTFLSRVSAARPKVADYPFTTLQPLLGIVHRDHFGMVIADLPGLIEGAHQGAGLGDRFLRHVARTRVLLQLVDASEGAEAAIAAYHTVRSELALSGLALEDKPVIVALSRADTVEDPAAVARTLERACGMPICVLSAHTGLGVAEVLGRRARLLEDVPRQAAPPAAASEIVVEPEPAVVPPEGGALPVRTMRRPATEAAAARPAKPRRSNKPIAVRGMKASAEPASSVNRAKRAATGSPARTNAAAGRATGGKKPAARSADAATPAAKRKASKGGAVGASLDGRSKKPVKRAVNSGIRKTTKRRTTPPASPATGPRGKAPGSRSRHKAR